MPERITADSAVSTLNVGSWGTEEVMHGGISGTSSPREWLIEALGAGTSDAGIRVNGWTVLSSGPVYQAVTLVANDLAMLPVEVLLQGSGKKKKDKNHPIHRIWNDHGNDEMLPFSVRQTLQGWAMIHGNGVGAIHWEGGRPVGVYPINPWSVLPERLPFVPELGDAAGELIYRVWTDQGHEEVLFQHEVFHIKLFGNGIWGYSPLGLFKNTFGNGLAQEKFHGKSFANSSRPSGVLESDKGKNSLNSEARANLRREWDEIHSGLDNTGKIAILWDGIKWKPMSVTNEQAQMLESRKYYREEIAGIFNIPPHKLGAMENSSVRANIEEQNRSYVGATLMPYAVNWEQESRQKLMTTGERTRRSHVVRFNFKELLRADHKTRNEAYAIGRQWGWLTVNDILRSEDMDEIGEEGDVRLVPSNMADAKTGEPFTGKKDVPPNPATGQLPAPLPTSPAAPTEESNLAPVRNILMGLQAVEIKNLGRHMESKKTPFADNARRHYAEFPGLMVFRLKETLPKDRIDHVKPVLVSYCDESFRLVEGCTTPDELLVAAVQWPQRAENLLREILQKAEL